MSAIDFARSYITWFDENEGSMSRIQMEAMHRDRQGIGLEGHLVPHRPVPRRTYPLRRQAHRHAELRLPGYIWRE